MQFHRAGCVPDGKTHSRWGESQRFCANNAEPTVCHVLCFGLVFPVRGTTPVLQMKKNQSRGSNLPKSVTAESA